MSAFVVSDKHINTMLSFGSRHIDRISLPDGQILSFKDANDLQIMAEIMLKENYRSVNYRSRENEGSHQIKFEFEYKYTPIQIVKACQCFDYQCCETDDWKESNAYRINSWLMSSAISELPGYDQAEWGMA